MSPDLDDEFGHRLGALLAPPVVLHARPDAGFRLRARARTVAGLRRGAALAAAGLLMLAAVTLAGHPGPDNLPATGRWSGAGWLTTPVEVSTGIVVPGQQSCGGLGDLVRVGPDCLRVADSPLVIRQVSGIRVVAHAAGAASLELDLVSADQGEVRQIVNAGRGGHLVAFIYGTPRGAAVQSDRIVTITVGSAAEADELVATLGLRPDFSPQTGPGELDTPLTVRPVLGFADPPCAEPSVEHGGSCPTLGRPLVAVRTVQDLAVLGPDRESTSVRIRVELPPATSATLKAFSAAHRGQQIAFEVRDRVVGRLGGRIEGRLDGTVEILLRDQDEAERVFRQLRP
jgi:hypothetical protein